MRKGCFFFQLRMVRSCLKKQLGRISHTYHLHIQQVLAEQSPGSRAGRKGGEANAKQKGPGDAARSLGCCAPHRSVTGIGSPRIRGSLARTQAPRDESTAGSSGARSEAGAGLRALRLCSDRSAGLVRGGCDLFSAPAPVLEFVSASLDPAAAV